MPKLSHIQRITLGGLFLALIIILTRFLSFQNIPLIPFVRISIGPSLIIFGSLIFGPIYGGIIGGLSDILGIVLVPNALGYGINPWFTVIYTLLGVFPWCVYKLIKLIKNEKILYILSVSLMASLAVFLTVFLGIVSDFTLFGKDYHLDWWVKLIIVASAFVLTILTSIGLLLINKFMKKKYDTGLISIYQISFVSIASQLVVLLILNSIVKTVFFGTDYLIIFFSQAVVFFINVILDTFIISLLSILVNKFFRKSNNYEDEKV